MWSLFEVEKDYKTVFLTVKSSEFSVLRMACVVRLLSPIYHLCPATETRLSRRVHNLIVRATTPNRKVSGGWRPNGSSDSRSLSRLAANGSSDRCSHSQKLTCTTSKRDLGDARVGVLHPRRSDWTIWVGWWTTTGP